MGLAAVNSAVEGTAEESEGLKAAEEYEGAKAAADSEQGLTLDIIFQLELPNVQPFIPESAEVVELHNSQLLELS